MTSVSQESKTQSLAIKEKGNEFYKKRQFEEALSCYDEAIKLDPTNMTFLNNKAAVYFEKGEFQNSIKECEKAVEVGRENRADFKLIAKAYSRMASCYKNMEDLENAKIYFQKSLTEHRTPDTVSKLSDVEKLIKENERKAYIDPEKSIEEKEKGNELFKKGHYPEAIKHYCEAIKRNPDDAKLYSNRAACYQKLAEFNLALKDCDECIRLDPTFVKGYIRKGHSLMALKEFTKASSAFQKAVEIDGNNKEALDGLMKCSMVSSSNLDEVRQRAMNDPEIQSIISDPAMRLILEQMQNDPKAVREHLKNPDIQQKIMKLVDAGLVR